MVSLVRYKNQIRWIKLGKIAILEPIHEAQRGNREPVFNDLDENLQGSDLMLGKA